MDTKHVYQDKENISPQDHTLILEEHNMNISNISRISRKASKKYDSECTLNIQSIRQENKLLKKEINSQKEQLQTLAVGIEQQNEKNAKLQHETASLQQQLQSLGDSCWNDANLMAKLCKKLGINSRDYSHNLNGLITFVSDYNDMKHKLSNDAQEIERYKKEIATLESKHFEKAELLHIESLRAENENLRKEICILEDSNSKLANDLIQKSGEAMKEIQSKYNKKEKEYEKKIAKIKREKKAYQHKCQHFKKETNGFATKYEELSQQHSELQTNYSQTAKSDDIDVLKRENMKLKSGNKAMHSQVDHVKKAYSALHNKHEIISKKYEILKEDWQRLNTARSNAMEKVCESENKASSLQLTIEQLNKDNKKEDSVVEEEIHLLRVENSNLKQDRETQLCEIEDLENRDKQLRKELDEWIAKYEDINNKYEFESAQHDNTLKKLTDLRAVCDGETKLSQLLQVKQQTILELQSKINELNTVANVDVDEYKPFQQELNVFNELQSKYQLSTNQSTHVQMQELVAYLHQTDNECAAIKAENASLNNTIQSLKNNKMTLANSLKVTQECNVKLRDELYAFSSTADLVQEQLKTSAVALSSTTDSKLTLLQEIDTLRRTLSSAQQQINKLQNKNYNLHHYNNKLQEKNTNKSEPIETPKLLDSFNNLRAENEELQAKNQALCQQLQIEQINKYVQTSKLPSNVSMDNLDKETNEIKFQSLVKRGKLLTEQCADLHVENRRLTQKISDFEEQAVNKNSTMDGIAHETVLKELRHRNEQLLNQLRSLQQDIQTDTELIDAVHKENDELRTKIKTLLQHPAAAQNDESQQVVEIAANGDEIINGLRDQLQEAKSEITALCQESMGKTKHINELMDSLRSEIKSMGVERDSLCSKIQALQKQIDDLKDIIHKNKIKYSEHEDKTKEYTDKICKMNEAVTKLSSARTKLQNELIEKDEKHNIQSDYLKNELKKTAASKQKLEKKLKSANKKNSEFNRKIESALKQKVSVDEELTQLQALHNNKAQNLEDLLSKYQQSVQENEIIKISKEQHSMLVQQIEHLHKQLTASREQHKQLRGKAQLHYLKRKEEWKKIKQFENKNNFNFKEVNALCQGINAIMQRLKEIHSNQDGDTEHKAESDEELEDNQYSFANISAFLQTTLVSLKFYLYQNGKQQNENENTFKLIQQQNHSLKSQLRRNTNDLQKLEEENNNLRGNTISNDMGKEGMELKELISALESEKASLCRKNNELHDGNVSLEEENKKSQLEIGKTQIKAERLKQQRDYAKVKYKELKAKLTFLEQQVGR